MKTLSIQLTQTPTRFLSVGRLAEADRRVFFEYAPEFLETSLELSPFKLPLGSGLIEHTDRSFGPLPGLFEDSLPDGWGLLLMDRYFRSEGLVPGTVSPIDRLAYLGTRTMGGLTYHPAEEVDPSLTEFNLQRIAKNARDVLAGTAKEVLPELMRAGGSPGGARPKVLVGVREDRIISGEDELPDGYEAWIVKFSAKEDFKDAGPVEYAYARMARAAGIEMPPNRLFETSTGDCFFGVKRFDREGNHRRHIHTFGNLIHANFRVPGCDYMDMLKAVSLLTRNHQDVLRSFRQMVFNVAAHNRDDHVKNFSFIMDEEGRWSLSPAYDLMYSLGPGGEHSMTILGEGREPTHDNFLQLAGKSGISSEQAARIVDQVRDAVSS